MHAKVSSSVAMAKETSWLPWQQKKEENCDRFIFARVFSLSHNIDLSMLNAPLLQIPHNPPYDFS